MNKELLINSLMMYLKEKCYQFAVPVEPFSDYDSFEDEFADCADDYRTELIEIIEKFEHDECKRCTRANLADNILSIIEDTEQDEVPTDSEAEVDETEFAEFLERLQKKVLIAIGRCQIMIDEGETIPPAILAELRKIKSELLYGMGGYKED